jgi:uncharacterized membrane protein YfcA
MSLLAGWDVTLALFLVAVLYSAVGHGGASGYWAVAALLMVPNQDFRGSVLMMNIGVSLLSFAHFSGAGHFRFKLFLWFAITSIPFSFLGAQVKLAQEAFEIVVAVFLLVSVLRLLWKPAGEKPTAIKPWLALLIGAAIGFFSGLIGIGGGILLSPVILLLGWGSVKESAAVSALFIVVNSLAGLLAMKWDAIGSAVPSPAWWVAVLSGALLGGWLGSRKLNPQPFRWVLAAVLVVASAKILFF